MATSSAPFGFLPSGAMSGLRRSVIDPETGNPVITSAPTGEVVQRSALLPVGRDDGGALTPAVPGLLMGMADAAAYPGQVARGEASIRGADGRISDEAVGKAFDLAGTAMTGSLPFSAPAGALRVFGGRTAATADHAALARAEEMAGRGASRGDTWADTGWFKGGDGQHRFEIPDQNARMTGANFAPSNDGFETFVTRPLGEVMDHPDLYRAYPDLAKVRVNHSPEFGEGAQFQPGLYGNPGTISLDANRPGALSRMLHEVQHDVQRREGFATGSSPSAREVVDHPDVLAANGTRTDLIAARQAEMDAIRPKSRNPIDDLTNPATDAQAAALDAVTQRYAPQLQAARVAGDAARYDAYRRSAGEVEARNVQDRAGMGHNSRRGIAPWESADTPEGRQWIAPALGAAAAFGLAGPGTAQAAPSPPAATKGPPMTPGIPFGFGFGAMPIPNADPDDLRRLAQRMPFDPAQAPGPSAASDPTGPAGALVHHPGWSATGTGTGTGAAAGAGTGGRYPGLLTDQPQGVTDLPAPGFDAPGGPAGQPVTASQFDQRFDASPPGEGYGLTASRADPMRAGLERKGGVPMQAPPLPPERPLDLSAGANAPEPPPTRYTGLGPSGAPPAAPAARPYPGALAIPQPQQQSAAAAPPAAGQAQPPTVAPADDGAGGGFLSRLGDPRVYNTLLGIGQGLLTTKGLGQALAVGTAQASKLNKDQAATDLAQAEYGIKRQKAAQEARQLTGNATYVKNAMAKAGQPITDDQALALGGNSTFVGELFKGALPPTELFRQFTDKDGNVWNQNSRTGQATVALQAKDESFNLSPGQTRYDSDGKPIVSAGPAKPENFDVETKLRTEFAKGLGSFNDVHDGYGRVIAATRQRQDNPSTVSPASDIGLIFGYMKMLDPGSVVREGEYATAANAAGIPERVANAYNKALKGEFLTPEQRQDFVGQAAELYGTARKTAEGVAGRYRNLAGQYKVDPDRSVYLPEMPTAPTVGPNRTKPAQGQAPGSPPGTSRSDLEAEARRRGLLR